MRFKRYIYSYNTLFMFSTEAVTWIVVATPTAQITI